MKYISLLCDHNITKKPRSSRMLQLLDKIKQEGAKLSLSVISKACDTREFNALGIESHFFVLAMINQAKSALNKKMILFYLIVKVAILNRLFLHQIASVFLIF
ncbi:hypothetical protein [uncultured Helicobacter sp.]|uniref:hypothetical protein n=1 Tax=uncultured Helicobacter sp. TaxID=175537 RepID=UPI00260A472F|nr:hypothetical protein [uncultured Helicobacter sp.]